MVITGKAVRLIGFVETTLRCGSESAEPVLHFTSGLCTQHQRSERGDHLTQKKMC